MTRPDNRPLVSEFRHVAARPMKPPPWPTLAEVCPQYRDKMAEFNRLAQTDLAAAEVVFAQASDIAKAFYAGVAVGQGQK